jgi:uncharacterized protein
MMIFLLTFSLSCCVCMDVMAAENRLFDNSGVLTDEEESQLEEELAALNQNYPVDVMILITDGVYEDSRQYAAGMMQSLEIGYGTSMDGVCLLHEPSDRNITIVFRGTLQDAFSEDIQDIILDDCTEKLEEDDFFGAYEVVLEDLVNCMERVAAGETIRPMDVHGGGILGFAFLAFVISFVVMAIPTLLLTLHQRSRMHMIEPAPNADSYIPQDGFHLTAKSDRYIRTNTIRTPKPKDNNKGGSSGSFKSGGESFSGSSRHY